MNTTDTAAREAFEAHWCRDVPREYRQSALAEMKANRTAEDGYERDEIRWAWEAWQAALATTPQTDSATAKLRAIHDLLHTQDNRITAAPMFAVQEKKRAYGVDESYGGKIVWITDDGDEVEAEEDAALEAAYQKDYDAAPRGFRRVGYREYWEFVTACFTEQGCKDYLERNGHNLHETRIYAYGTYRNAEWQTVRDFLMSDRFAATHAPAMPKQPTTEDTK